ncbi:MAG: YihY/virulence factor BrkB family protein [Lachnospiraceae bacterium]|nr:YihY/virulence factor BrkB family protein [Lachnospiraceae bacterium]
MIKIFFRRLFRFPIRLVVRINEDKVGIYTGQAAFFMFLSFFPLIMLVLNLVSRTNLIPDYIIPNYIEKHLPFSIQGYRLNIINQFQNASSSTLISISAMLAIWAASKGAMAIISGLRLVLDSDKTKNWFILRIQSILYTLLLLISIIISMILVVFGNSIFWKAASENPFLYNFASLYTISRYVIVLVILTLFFAWIFKIGANSALKYSDMIPGAMFTTIGWMIFSYLFSIYIENISSFSYMYGSIAAVIIIMMWLYFCMYILFIGAEVNIIIYEFDTSYKSNSNSNKNL